MKNETNGTLPERLLRSVKKEELILPNEKILVAFSGGVDSVVLLFMLKKLAPELKSEIFAFHLNHGIRGEEADRDERFCIDFCKTHDIPITVKHVSVPKESERTGEGLEECARRLRYTFLNECARDIGCVKIATAHHADDNIETVLLHLIRGAGLGGLVGMTPRRDNIIRPMLPFRKRELIQYCTDERLSCVYDSTNSDIAMTRNKIRHRLLDTVYEINPRADVAFSSMSALVNEDNKFLLSLADGVNSDSPLSELSELPTPILSRFLQKKYRLARERLEGKSADTGMTPSSAQPKRKAQLSLIHLTPIIDFIKTGSGNASFSLPADITARVSASGVDFTPAAAESIADYKIPLFLGENNISQCGYKILITNDKNVAEEWQNIYKLSIPASVNFDTIPNVDSLPLFVRNKRAGDSYIYGGHTRDVRHRLIDLKIPAHRRSRIPCICDGQGIIWVPHLRVADRLRPQKNGSVLYLLFTEANGN